MEKQLKMTPKAVRDRKWLAEKRSKTEELNRKVQELAVGNEELKDELAAERRLLIDANAFIRDSNERRKSIDEKIFDLEVGMGSLYRSATRWKFAFLFTLFVIAVPATVTTSAMLYFGIFR